MSDGEIVFDDVKYREPERRCRPDRDRRWATLAYEVPGPADLPVFLDRLTADAIERHALSDTSVELGGILLGKECLDEATGLPFVLVTRSLEAKHYENTQASFTYTHDSWEEITRERDRLYPDLDVVGWYHTHPDFGVFLSGHDLFIHHNFFSQPLQVAYVVDPIRQTRGFFQWRGDGMDQVGGFYLFAGRGERVALSRLVDDLENLPSTEGGGGGLSPRLEAELIAMLSRPAPHYAAATDRTQTAALFSLIGGLIGMFGLAGVLWLYTLNSRVAEQGQVLDEIKRMTGDSITAERLALDRLMADSSIKEPDKFASLYGQVVRERDESRKDADRWRTRETIVNDQARSLAAENEKLRKELGDARKTADRYKQEVQDSPDLMSRLSELKAESADKSQKIKDLEVLYGAATDKEKAAELLGKYQRAWYFAMAGWAVGLIMTLGVLALLAQPRSSAEISGESQAGDSPPHRIS